MLVGFSLFRVFKAVLLRFSGIPLAILVFPLLGFTPTLGWLFKGVWPLLGLGVLTLLVPPLSSS